jgi:hypothetical protein
MIQWIIEQGGRILSPFPMFHVSGFSDVLELTMGFHRLLKYAARGY